MEKGDLIAVSDLVRCYLCPVRFYFERNEPRTESDRYIICKQLSYHLGTPFNPETIWQEVLAVYPHIDPALRQFLDECTAACSQASWRPAAQTDVKVASDRYGIVGMVDRIGIDEGFSIIRAADAPRFGMYVSDRLRIVSYALCLEEMSGQAVKGGNVAYIPGGEVRFHTVQPRDRRLFLAALRQVRAIDQGDIPRRPLNAPCDKCRHKERCERGGRRLSDLL